MLTTKHGDPAPKHYDRGAVVARWVRCGKSWCRCSNGGPRHGPYYSRYWREGGRRHKEYIRLDAARSRQAACDERRVREREDRRRVKDARKAWRELLGALRAYEWLGRRKW
jgi:hypothetical protein